MRTCWELSDHSIVYLSKQVVRWIGWCSHGLVHIIPYLDSFGNLFVIFGQDYLYDIYLISRRFIHHIRPLLIIECHYSFSDGSFIYFLYIYRLMHACRHVESRSSHWIYVDNIYMGLILFAHGSVHMMSFLHTHWIPKKVGLFSV